MHTALPVIIGFYTCQSHDPNPKSFSHISQHMLFSSDIFLYTTLALQPLAALGVTGVPFVQALKHKYFLYCSTIVYNSACFLFLLVQH